MCFIIIIIIILQLVIKPLKELPNLLIMLLGFMNSYLDSGCSSFYLL